MEEIEELRNKLNFEIRGLLTVIDMIDGLSSNYQNYEENTLNELEYLKQQLELVTEAKNRLINIFKD